MAIAPHIGRRRRRGLGAKDRFSTSGRRPAARRRSATRRGAWHRPGPRGRSTARGSGRPGAPAPRGLPPRARRRARPSATSGVGASPYTRSTTVAGGATPRELERGERVVLVGCPARAPPRLRSRAGRSGPGCSAWPTPSSAASAAARACVRFHTDTSAPGLAQRPRRRPGRRPRRPSTSARRPATGSSSAAISPPASVLSALMRPSAKLSVLAAPMASAAGLTSSASARAASLCGIVTFAPTYPEAGSARTVSANSSGRHGQLHVAPVEAELEKRRAHHDRRAAVPDRVSEHSGEGHQQLVGERPPASSRACS